MSEEKQSSTKSAGPYTPLRTPVDVGQKSGGEFQWEHSSASLQHSSENK